MISFDSVPEYPVNWLWPGRIAFGEVTLFAAPAKSGKSRCLRDIAARATTGLWPDGAVSAPRNVVACFAEDDRHSIVRPGLEKAGAVLSMVTDASLTDDGGELCLPRDVGELRGIVDDTHAGLMIIDTLSRVAEGSVNTVLAAKKLVLPLTRMARETGCAIVAVTHVRADGAIAGSHGLPELVRSIARIEVDKANPADRTLFVDGNLGPADPLTFQIASDRIHWLTREEVTRRELSWRGLLPSRRAGASQVHAEVPVRPAGSIPAPSRGHLSSVAKLTSAARGRMSGDYPTTPGFPAGMLTGGELR